MRKLILMNAEILYRSLKIIENVYDDSMYDEDDFYRIKDIIHSLDKNHWDSKQWLVDILGALYMHSGGSIYIGGGWYGLLAHLLRKEFPQSEMNITSADIDGYCEKVAWRLFPESNIQFKTEDMMNVDLSAYSIVVSTSCEHVERDDLEKFIRSKPSNTWVVLQSNNFFDLTSHINCHNSLEEFTEWVDESLSECVAYSGMLELDGFERYMVIGR